MDYFHSFPTISTIAIISFPLLLFLFSLLWISKTASRNTNKKKTAPEAGGAWPVIGHLHIQESLANMADKYGTIFTIKWGVHKALVVSNSAIAKECLTKNDKVFATRPKLTGMEVLGYNTAMLAFAPYGPYWRQVRKIFVGELISNNRLDMLKHARETEVKTSLKHLYQIWNKNNKTSGSDKVLVEMNRWFRDVTLNLILKMVVGKRVPNSSEGGDTMKWRKSLDNFNQLSGKLGVSDGLPYLRWLDIGGEEKLMKKIAKELDQVLEGWLREHKQKRAENEAKSEEDLMGVMLSILSDAEEHDADTIIKATSLGVIAADYTMSKTMIWALFLLLHNREALKKVQQELDIQVGKDRLLVTESETKNLVYLQSIIKETLRLYPAVPQSMIHEAIEDCTINEYHVSAGTWLIINIQMILRDPNVWSNPSEFRPERFLTTHKNVDVKGQNFEFIPFGGGRRMCPGIPVALPILQLTLANLLHWFKFETPSEPEGTGSESPKVLPLEAYITPRLPAFLFESTS